MQIQLTLKDFVEVKKESHPYYNLWRVLSEYCTENYIGRQGESTFKKGLNDYEKRVRVVAHASSSSFWEEVDHAQV